MASCVFEIRPLNRDSVELRICARCGNAMIINIEMNLEKTHQDGKYNSRKKNFKRTRYLRDERRLFSYYSQNVLIINSFNDHSLVCYLHHIAHSRLC